MSLIPQFLPVPEHRKVINGTNENWWESRYSTLVYYFRQILVMGGEGGILISSRLSHLCLFPLHFKVLNLLYNPSYKLLENKRIILVVDWCSSNSSYCLFSVLQVSSKTNLFKEAAAHLCMFRSLKYRLMSRWCPVFVTLGRHPAVLDHLYCLLSFQCWAWFLLGGFNAVLCWNIVRRSLLLLMIIMMCLFTAGWKWETAPLYMQVLSVSWWGCCQSCTKKDMLRWAWTYQNVILTVSYTSV